MNFLTKKRSVKDLLPTNWGVKRASKKTEEPKRGEATLGTETSAQASPAPTPTAAPTVSATAYTPRKDKKIKKAYFVRFPIKEQVHFAKRLSFLINAGVSIVEALHLLHKQARSSSQKHVYERVISDVSSGQFLSTSLGRFEHLFGSFAVNIIKIGETGGVLSQNLEYLATELQKKQELRKKIIGALVYPIFITIATLLLCGILTVFIFPKVMPIFQSLGVSLPLSTIILLWLSNFLSAWGLHLIGGIIVFVILMTFLIKNVMFIRLPMHHVVLRLPLFGKMLKYYYMTNFTRTLGLLLKSGVNVVEAVETTGETMTNEVYKRECKQMAQVVMRGGRISEYLEKRRQYFPDVTSHLIAVGETSGSLSNTLVYLSEMYENEVSDITKNLSNSIEPILMIFMGFLVGFVAISVITPIYEVTQHLNP